MHVQRNRIFVGNLPPSVNENDIKEQFSQYGQIVSVEIKHRKENSNDNVSPVFAFVSIETDKNQLNECFNEVPNYNWHGYYVKLELAKESFLERLKREREEAQANNDSAKPAAVAATSAAPAPAKLNPPIITGSKSNKIVYSSSNSSSSSDSSDSENEVVKVPKTTVKAKTQNGDLISSEDNDLVIKNNKNKQLTNGKLTIESVNSTPIHIITRKQNGLYKENQKLTPADEKRLNSLYKMKESYDQQKSLIKNALSHIDTKASNKIVFDENGQQSNKRKQNFNDRPNHYKKEKVSLFADNEQEEDDDINFEIQNKYEGKKGQKLFALQSRYTNDRRFTLDSRFLDEENDEENVDETYDNEKQKQYEILESVIGRKLTEMPEHKHNAPKGMLRYDPSNVEHSKFEMKAKRATIEEQPKKEIVQEAPVEVSKETFYKVTDNLKQSFKEKQEFSLLSMFGRTEDKDEKESETQDATEINQMNFKTNQNPFRYDSSDDNEAEEAPYNTEQINQFDQRQIRQNFSRFGEKFFFQVDDERLKDGVNFLQKFNNEEEHTHKFVDTRRKIKQLIRGKIRNVQRDNRLFRKKIGQHKQIKIKKAKRN